MQDNFQKANNSVAILFQEEQINVIFSALLNSRGVETSIIDSIENLTESAKIITEPQFFKNLSEESRKKCLVVGNKDVIKDIESLSLSRPLTEEKIEDALSKFLAI